MKQKNKVFAGMALAMSLAGSANAAVPYLPLEAVAPADATKLTFVSQRPKVENRLFHSEAVVKEIARVKKLLKKNP